MSKRYNRIVLTGATGGIGGAIAKVLDQAGYHLLLTGRSEKKLEELLQSLQGTAHVTLIADLTQQQGVDSLGSAAEVFNADGLINCLGVNQLSTLAETDSADISRLIATNLVAPMNICRILLPLFGRQQKAMVINVGSILGSIGYAGSTVYCTSKFGLRGFTESLRRELADTNIRVIYLAPRATDTELNDDAIKQLNRELGNTVDSPERVAEQLLRVLETDRTTSCFLGRPEAFFVRLNALLPSMVDKVLSKQLNTIKQYCRLD